MDRNSDWNNHYCDDLEHVKASDMTVGCYEFPRKVHKRNLYWISVEQYVIFEGFETPEEAERVLSFIRDTEILFV